MSAETVDIVVFDDNVPGSQVTAVSAADAHTGVAESVHVVAVNPQVGALQRIQGRAAETSYDIAGDGCVEAMLENNAVLLAVL